MLKLLRKVKRASACTFTFGFYKTDVIRDLLRDILEFAGFAVRNRATFENVQDYNNENTRRIIFRGSLEEVIRLFYLGNHADYEEIISDVNQIRRLQREITPEDALLVELPVGIVLLQAVQTLNAALPQDMLVGGVQLQLHAQDMVTGHNFWAALFTAQNYAEQLRKLLDSLH